MNLEDFVSLMINHGLGVAISIYLVYWVTNKMSKQIEQLKESIDRNTNALNELVKAINQKT